MIVGAGVDIVGWPRVERLLRRHGPRFLTRCFAPGEVVRPAEAAHLAGLLAAKEAGFKALGVGRGSGVGWRQLEVRRQPHGGPRLELSGAALERARALGVTAAHLSISHDAGVSVAFVVLEGKPLP